MQSLVLSILADRGTKAKGARGCFAGLAGLEPGFKLDERTLAFPHYDGNGIYRTWGNPQAATRRTFGHAPRHGYTPPVPAWKTFDVFSAALPARDRTGGEQG